MLFALTSVTTPRTTNTTAVDTANILLTRLRAWVRLLAGTRATTGIGMTAIEVAAAIGAPAVAGMNGHHENAGQTHH